VIIVVLIDSLLVQWVGLQVGNLRLDWRRGKGAEIFGRITEQYFYSSTVKRIVAHKNGNYKNTNRCYIFKYML